MHIEIITQDLPRSLTWIHSLSYNFSFDVSSSSLEVCQNRYQTAGIQGKSSKIRSSESDIESSITALSSSRTLRSEHYNFRKRAYKKHFTFATLHHHKPHRTALLVFLNNTSIKLPRPTCATLAGHGPKYISKTSPRKRRRKQSLTTILSVRCGSNWKAFPNINIVL